jgi:hypothetical protein
MDSKKQPQRINAELIYFQLNEITKRLDKFETVFVTKAESIALKEQIIELAKDLQDSKETLSREITDIKKSKNLWAWLSPTLTAILTAIMTFITIEYLRRK